VRRALGTLLLVIAAAAAALGQQATLPRLEDSIKLAVIGDSGTGGTRQYELARILAAAREQFAFDFAIMLGDNIYGSDRPKDYIRKFETPYKPLLDAGVKFYAALGNHDARTQVNYQLFNMDGKRYYSHSHGPVQFFVLDSTYVDPAQMDWLERELAGSTARWKMAYFHHPIYSSGARHGSEMDLRELVEPLFVKYGVDVVFSGHEHFYERINPQRGIYYFTSGAAGKLRRGNIRRGTLTATGYDQDLSFMLVEVAEDQLHFQVISRTGTTVDSGALPRPADGAEQTETQPDEMQPGNSRE
jgi:predicted phosphodiesterase